MSSDNAIFVLHPEHKKLKRGELPSGFRPMIREADRNRGCLKIIALCNMVLLLALIVYLIGSFNQLKRFLDEGHPVTADVIACRMVYKDDFYRPEVQYSYIVDSLVYHKLDYLNGDCTAYIPGQEIRGVYLPSDPAQSSFTKQPSSSHEIFNRSLFVFLVFGCAGMLIVTMLLGMGYVSLRSSGVFHMWESTNAALEGHIVKIYYEIEDLLVVEYRFKLSPQESLDGRDKARRPDLVTDGLPWPGTTVTVLYTDHNTHRLL